MTAAAVFCMAWKKEIEHVCLFLSGRKNVDLKKKYGKLISCPPPQHVKTERKGWFFKDIY